MIKCLLFTTILWASVSVAGNQPFPRTGVLPEQITTDDSIMVAIAANIPPCLGSSNSYPTFYHLSANNQITFVFVASIVSPCPIIFDFTMLYDIGALPAGDYSIQVYTVGGPLDIPQSINDPLGIPLGELVEFSVRGVAEAKPVPLLSFWAIRLFILTILLSTFISKKIKNV